MRFLLRCLLLSFLAGLAGCAGAEYRWVKPGADAAALERDRNACREQVRRDFNPNYDYGPPGRHSPVSERMLYMQIEVDEMFADCMRKRGYRTVKVEPAG